MSNIYKRFLAMCAAIVVVAGMALAQSNGSASGDTQQAGQTNNQNVQAQGRLQQQRRIAMLTQRLNLTDDQKRQWIEIQRQTTQQVRATRMDQSLSEEQMQAKLKEIHKAQKDQIFAILTPQQQDQLKKFWEEQRQRQQSEQSSGNDSVAVKATTSKDLSSKDDLFADMMPDPGSAQAPTKNPTPHH